MNKTIKFASDLIPLVQAGTKSATWRLFDDKALTAGDTVTFINRETGKSFARAELVTVYEKPLGQLSQEDWVGHEPFSSDQEMYKKYEEYYHRPVTVETTVKIIQFKLLKQPRVIIVSGMPGIGKTTFATELSERLAIPLLYKDRYKELLYDAYGPTLISLHGYDPLSTFSYNLLYSNLEELIKKGVDAIIESNFIDAYDTPKLTALQNTYCAKLYQVHCHSELQPLLDRIAARAAGGQRHAVHADAHNLDQYAETFLAGRNFKLAIDGPTLIFDTTHLSPELKSSMIEETKALLAKES